LHDVRTLHLLGCRRARTDNQIPTLYTLEEYQIALESLAKGHVEPRAIITEVVSLDRLPAVFESLRKPSQQCKVMMNPWA
jgi:threonine dehydrogenase-like Zn-dependent dehydrogenase